MTWLDGWERIPVTNAPGFPQRVDSPWKLVLHSTEGSTIEGAVGAYQRQPSAPQGTLDPHARRAAQHISLQLAAYSLEHRPGTVETNGAYVVQFEIVGFAAEACNLDDDDLAWLASRLNEVRTHCPFALVSPDTGFHDYPPEGGHRLGAEPWRMTDDEWLAFGGICGHQHVPGNVHGDPGRIPIDQLIALMQPAAPVPAPTPTPIPDLEDFMAALTPKQAENVHDALVLLGVKAAYEMRRGPGNHDPAQLSTAKAISAGTESFAQLEQALHDE